MDSSTGRFWRSSPSNNDWPMSNESSEMNPEYTPSPVDRMPRTNTFGKMTPQSKVQGSSLEPNPSVVIRLKTGPPSRIQLSPGNWMTSRTICSLDITGPSEQLLLTIVSQLQYNARLSFSGVQLESGSLDEHGKKQASLRIQKTLSVSSGVDTEIIKTLSWMNSVVELASHTSYDGSIDTLLSLTSKDRVQSFWQRISGLLPTCILENGTPI